MGPTRTPDPPFRAPAAGLALLALVVAGAGCTGGSRDSVREMRTASAVPMAGHSALRIETRSADVHLIQSPDDTLRVVTTRRVQAGSERTVESILSQIKVTMEPQGDVLVLRVREPERGRTRVRGSAGPWRHRRSVEVELTIAVPARVRVDGETMSGDFDAVGMAQALSLVATSGDIDMSQLSGPARAQTTSGDVTLRDLGQGATVKVTAGDVDAVEVRGPLMMRATSGDLSAQQAHGGVRLETSTGEIEVHGVEGTVMASTSAGDVDVSAAAADSCVVETASGDIAIALVRPSRHLEVRSSSGAVTLRLPPGAGGALDLQTASGAIQVKSAIEVEVMNRNRLSGRLGGSGAIAVRTSSGDITLATSEGVTP
ncbi:MAG: DUF4097 family beta strand repeat-containing protein [Candidatus Eisenbacteria bacterium]